MKVHIFTDKLILLARPDGCSVCLSSTDAVAATDLAQAASEPGSRAAGLCLRRPGRAIVRHHLSQKHQVKHSHLLRRYPGNYLPVLFISCLSLPVLYVVSTSRYSGVKLVSYVAKEGNKNVDSYLPPCYIFADPYVTADVQVASPSQPASSQ